ncbi:hypothetical protein OG241_21210 [Streptomyces sp. NBC_01390]|uniref:hypothetical protein n=1 Tax=Streptomyces sp. NBC_01390 TaxID=2903850 RepID=UPI00324FAA10
MAASFHALSSILRHHFPHPSASLRLPTEVHRDAIFGWMDSALKVRQSEILNHFPTGSQDRDPLAAVAMEREISHSSGCSRHDVTAS